MPRPVTAFDRRLRRDAQAWSRLFPPGTPVAVRVGEDSHEVATHTRSTALWDAGHLEAYVVGLTAPVPVSRIRRRGGAPRPRRCALATRLSPLAP